MLVLFDNGTPRTLARYLIDHHAVTEARARGWEQLENGDLLTVAEAAGFEVLVTTDKNLPYQQNLAGRKLAVGANVLFLIRQRLDCGPQGSAGRGDSCPSSPTLQTLRPRPRSASRHFLIVPTHGRGPP